MESSTEEVGLRLPVFLRTLPDMLRDDWPSNGAQSFCVWFEVKWNFNWRRRCAVICPTPGTCLTTGLVTNLTRNIAKHSFSSNSSQLYISGTILSRWYEFITWDWGSLPNYPPLPPLLPSNPLLLYSRFILAFCVGGNSLMVLFYHYRYSKNPRITT